MPRGIIGVNDKMEKMSFDSNIHPTRLCADAKIYMCLIISLANSEHFTFFAPCMRRSKS